MARTPAAKPGNHRGGGREKSAAAGKPAAQRPSFASMVRNRLYFGDNLEVLRRHLDDESVDLIYLDPPFNSNADYNVLFAEHDRTESAAQIQAFEDTWKWDSEAAKAFHEAVQSGHAKVPEAMQAFKTFLGESDMLAYLSMMAPRLIELHRVLKPTGSIYLHCDPTASHYLKLLMDAVFGPQNFVNEVTWKRTYAHGAPTRWGPVHDTILFYARGAQRTWQRQLQAHTDAYLESKYRFEDERGRYRLVVLTGPGATQGESGQAWRGYDPTSVGRHWAVPMGLLRELVGPDELEEMSVHEKLDYLDAQGFIHWPKRRDGQAGTPEVKRYLDAGQPIQDVVTDIFPINSQAQERLGYPTQKPEALLERIIKASSNEGEVVLDPFCGCGTAIAVAEKLHRKWIGIDITHLAINLIKTRLRDAFNIKPPEDYDVIGEPTDLAGAEALAAQDKFQFQAWALGLVGARVAGSSKKGADKGIDGKLFFMDDPNPKKADTKQVIFSVKGGGTGVKDVRDLRGVLDRESGSGAVIGVLISLNEPTREMRAEAASAGMYDSPWGTSHSRLQVITIEELLDGRPVGMPRSTDIRAATFKKAPRVTRNAQGEKGLYEPEV